MDYYLVNRHGRDGKLRLKVSQNNKNDFRSLFDIDINEIRRQNTNIFSNFIFFYDNLLGEISIEKLYGAIKRLQVVDIRLDHNTNPQIIFETLNSTGLDLKESDLIRNYILMSLPSNTQEEIFNKYWEKIENNIKNNETDFFRNYLYFKKNNYLNDKEIYTEFKKLYNKDFDKKAIAKELLKYSNYYNQIIKFNYDKKVNKNLKNLLSNDFLGYSIIISYLFTIIDKINSSALTIDNFREILEILESFLFRRFVCGYKTSDLRKIFIPLAKWIDNLGNDYTYFNKLMYFLKKYNFPDDVEFLEKWVSFEFYNKKSKSSQVQHILIEIEKNDNKEFVTQDLTIEHIVPQTLNKKWQDYLGDEFENIKDNWLHTMGNLTNTAYNPELSNKPFEEKKQIYEKSNIKITRDITSYERWDIKNIKDRARKLGKKAIKIWKYYKSNVLVKNDNSEIYLSEEGFDFTGYKPVQIFINNVKSDVKDWIKVYEIIFKKIYERDSNKFLEQVKKNKHFNKDKYNKKLKITDNVNFEGCFSSNQGLEIIRKFVTDFNDNDINCDNIYFVMRQNNMK